MTGSVLCQMAAHDQKAHAGQIWMREVHEHMSRKYLQRKCRLRDRINLKIMYASNNSAALPDFYVEFGPCDEQVLNHPNLR